MKVVIAEPVYPILNTLIEQNKKDWVIYDTKPKDNSEFLKRIEEAEIASAYFSKFDRDILSQTPKLKYLVIPAVGAGSSVDMQYAKSRGITVLNCPGYNSVAVAEMAIGLAIDLNRSISTLGCKMKNGIWGNAIERNKGLISGKKVGLVGYGNVGKYIQKLLGPWDMDFMVVNSKSTPQEIDLVVASSDILFICCSLNENTVGLITSGRIKSMKPSAILINVSRGAVVDEDALYESLEKGNITGAGLDVFIYEPTQPTAKLPRSIKRFTELENVVCTPHIAGSTYETGDVLCQMLFDNIESCVLGKPTNIYQV